MKAIDFHVHAGKFEGLRDDIQGLLTKKALEPGQRVERLFSEPELLQAYLTERGIERAVVLAECGPGTNFTIDSAMIAEFCRDRPFFLPFGSINPNYHDVRREFARSVELGIRGFKFYPADHGFDPREPAMFEVYAQCEKRKLPVMFHTGLTAQRDAEQKFIAPRDFLPIVTSFPELTVILAHAGKPTWYEDAVAMARDFAGVYLDTALVPPQALQEGPLASPTVRHKVLYGSDWPVSGNYSATKLGLEGALSEAAQRAIFRDNPARVLAAMGA